jgi:hypothetical protein
MAVNTTSTAGSSFVMTAGLLCLVGAVVGVISASSPPSSRPPFPSIDSVTRTHRRVFSSPSSSSRPIMCCCSSGYSASPGPVPPVAAFSGASGCGSLSSAWPAHIVRGMGDDLRHIVVPGPGTSVLDTSFGVASILIGIGLVLAGVAVARAGEWTGWRRFVPLICGVAVFAIVIPGVFGPFLAGRLVLAVWMLMFAALGLALYTRVRVPGVEPVPTTAGLH